MSESRTRSIFFPYVYGEDSLVVALERCLLDGKEYEAPWDEGLLECDLSKADQWNTVSLRFAVSRDKKQLWVPELVPRSERPSPPVRLRGSAHCGATLTRWAVDGTLDVAGGGGSVEIAIDRTEVRGTVDFSLHVVRTQLQEADGTFAADPAARIVAARAVTIRIDPAARREGSGLPIEWESFRASKNPFRAGRQTALFHLDTVKSPPVLYLNQDADPDLYMVMKDEAPRGSKAALRNLVFAAIAMPVWQGLLRTAVTAIDADGQVTPGWERDVLTEVARVAEPGSEPEEALRRFIRDLRDTAGGRQLEERLPTIFSQMVQFRIRAEQSTGALL